MWPLELCSTQLVSSGVADESSNAHFWNFCHVDPQTEILILPTVPGHTDCQVNTINERLVVVLLQGGTIDDKRPSVQISGACEPTLQ